MKRILVVDDRAENRFLFQAILEAEGYDVEVADGGKSALQQIAVNTPDLLLVDVMMPEMNGFEVTCAIRQSSQYPYIPILLVTAHSKPSVVEGLNLGANDFIRKPFKIDEFLARVRALTEN